MKISEKNFPHPVLVGNNSDYIDCSFELSEPIAKIEGESLYFDISYSLISDGLSKLLTDGTAKVLIKIYSPKTTYRNTFVFENTDILNVKIQKDDIAERIEIQGSIIANQSIEQFCLPEHNKDLFGTTYFKIRKADILAETKEIVIRLDASELEGPVASIFNITRKSDLDAAIYPDFNDDKIMINLNDKTYDAYKDLKSDSVLKRYLAAVIVFPVLIEALSLIRPQSEESDHADKRWYRMITKKLDDKNINLEDGTTKIANALLGDIVSEALISFREKIYGDFNGDLESGGAD